MFLQINNDIFLLFPEDQSKKDNVPVSRRAEGAEMMMGMLAEKQQGRR